MELLLSLSGAGQAEGDHRAARRADVYKRQTLTSQTLTHEQKLMNLAKEAENAFDVLDIPPRTRHFFETGAINDLFEGHAPYRPRYILPDYGAFVRQGSADVYKRQAQWAGPVPVCV